MAEQRDGSRAATAARPGSERREIASNRLDARRDSRTACARGTPIAEWRRGADQAHDSRPGRHRASA